MTTDFDHQRYWRQRDNSYSNIDTATPTTICLKTIDAVRPKHLSFSIDAILGKTTTMLGKSTTILGQNTPILGTSASYDSVQSGKSKKNIRASDEAKDFTMFPAFDWMQCTRYRPPKVTSECVLSLATTQLFNLGVKTILILTWWES